MTMNKKTLKELRKERGLTQRQLADELGVALRTIQGWENHHKGRGKISPVKRRFIARYYHVSEEDINF